MPIFEKLTARARVLERAARKGLRAEQYPENLRRIEQVIATFKKIDANDMASISGMAEHHQVSACTALYRGDAEALADHLPKAVQLRALLQRFYAAVPVLDTGVIALSYNASTALDLAAPTMLSNWRQGQACAEVLMAASRNEMKCDSGRRQTRSWGRGTVSAFIIELLSDAYDFSHVYSPQIPLVSEYVNVLSNFRTEDQSVFESMMMAVIARHIRESKNSARFKPPGDFDNDFDRFFPVELLCIQAIRRRDGLPGFDAKHPLVDAPWNLMNTFYSSARLDIADSVERVLRTQYAEFV